LGVFAKRAVCMERFGFKNVKCCATHLATVQCGDQVVLVDHAASAVVDEHDAFLAQAKSLGREKVAGLFIERDVESQDIGFGEHLQHVGEHAHLAIHAGGGVDDRVIRHHGHAHGDSAFSDGSTNTAKADYA